MFDELKLQTDKLINFQINESEYFDYINDLINSGIINDQYILDIIRFNIFIESKYTSRFYHLLLFLNDKQLLKKEHYTQLIKQNYNICNDIINLNNYQVINFIDDIKNNYNTINHNLVNYLRTIIKLIKNDIDNHRFLLFLNIYPELINRMPVFIKNYIYDKNIHISYKEWSNKYPKLWSHLLDFYNINFSNDLNFVSFNNLLQNIKHFDIDEEILFNMLIDKLNVIILTMNEYKSTPIYNFLIEYSFNKKELFLKYITLFHMLLCESKFVKTIFFIIHKKYYLDEYKHKIVNYLKNIIGINYDYIDIISYNYHINIISHNYHIHFFDFVFDNILDINTMITNHLHYEIEKFYKTHVLYGSNNIYLYSNLLLYLVKYIYNNNIDYNFNKYDKLVRCDFLNHYIDYNIDTSSNKFIDDINNYIDDINNFEYICYDNNLRSMIDKNFKYNNNRLIYQIIKNDIKITNIDKLLDYMNNNKNTIITFDDKIYKIKLCRFLDKYHKTILNKYNNLEYLFNQYKLNISYISKISNHKICDDICKNIFDYL